MQYEKNLGLDIDHIQILRIFANEYEKLINKQLEKSPKIINGMRYNKKKVNIRVLLIGRASDAIINVELLLFRKRKFLFIEDFDRKILLSLLLGGPVIDKDGRIVIKVSYNEKEEYISNIKSFIEQIMLLIDKKIRDL